jgi:hypothetical protein
MSSKCNLLYSYGSGFIHVYPRRSAADGRNVGSLTMVGEGGPRRESVLTLGNEKLRWRGKYLWKHALRNAMPSGERLLGSGGGDWLVAMLKRAAMGSKCDHGGLRVAISMTVHPTLQMSLFRPCPDC